MNTQLDTMFSEAEGRYLESSEEARLVAYAASVPSRLEAMRAVQAAETRIIDETLEEVWARHPAFESRHAMAREKARRDMTLVLRYAAMAMLRDDEEMFKERLLYWLVTILNANNMGAVIDTAYRALARRAETHLATQHMEWMAPYLRLAHTILTSSGRR
jgi:hypothetical protein